jgi:hypothetical protein
MKGGVRPDGARTTMGRRDAAEALALTQKDKQNQDDEGSSRRPNPWHAGIGDNAAARPSVGRKEA